MPKIFKNFFFKKKIAVTGSKGFIATHVIKSLKNLGVKNKQIIRINSKNTNYNDVNQLERKLKSVDFVIHLSSVTGGIKYTKDNTSNQFYLSSIKDINIFEASKRSKVKKLVTLGNLHAYPAKIKSKISENNLFDGLPSKVHMGVGWPKRNLSVMTDIYSRKSKTNFIVLYSANVYGPGDSLDHKYSHIIPTLILKCLNNKSFKIFGGLDSVREFIYVKDVANIILLSLAKLDKSIYINVGSGEKISIKNLLKKIKKITNFNKNIKNLREINDKSIRYTDRKKFKRLLNYKFVYNLDTGLKETIKWYKENI